MALGTKNQPLGYFEIGDLLYSLKVNEVYYTKPSLEATGIANGELLIGQITDNDVKSSDDTPGTWIEVQKTGSLTKVYVPLDSSRYESKANPKYNYPDNTTKKTGFNWEGLLAGISTLTTSLLGIFSKAKATAATGNDISGKDGQDPQPFNLLAWIKANILMIVALPLVVVLFVLLVKVIKNRKPKSTKPNATNK